MLRQQRVWSAQRISLVGMVIVAVIAAAVAVTIILYQLAIGEAADARAADLNAQRAQQLAAVTAEQRISMIEYLTTGSAAALSSAQDLDSQFDRVAGALEPGYGSRRAGPVGGGGHPGPLLLGVP